MELRFERKKVEDLEGNFDEDVRGVNRNAEGLRFTALYDKIMTNAVERIRTMDHESFYSAVENQCTEVRNVIAEIVKILNRPAPNIHKAIKGQDSIAREELYPCYVYYAVIKYYYNTIAKQVQDPRIKPH